MLTSARVEWPKEFYELKRGEGCPMCKQGRPDETEHGVRFFAGEVVDAYLQRAKIQRGYTVVVWRGRHVPSRPSSPRRRRRGTGSKCSTAAAGSTPPSRR